MRLLAAVDPVDFRRGIDGLAEVCRARLGSDPFLGTVFRFRNRSATAVKVLVYDGHSRQSVHDLIEEGRIPARR